MEQRPMPLRGKQPWFIGKWTTLTASTFVEASAGLTYGFAVYSGAFQTKFSYNQTQLQAVGAVGNLGSYLSIFAGLAYDALGDYPRLGPRVTLVVAAALCSVGYLGLWLALNSTIPASFPEVLLYAFLAGVSCNWMDVPAIITNIRNFQDHRGRAVGILKAFIGLSPSIYTSLYTHIFAPDAVRFVLFLAIFPPVLTLLATLCINRVPHAEEGERRLMRASSGLTSPLGMPTAIRFLLAFAAVSLLMSYQAVTALLSIGPLRPWQHAAIVSGMALLVAPMLLLPVGTGGLRSCPAAAPPDEHDDLCPLLPGSEAAPEPSPQNGGNAAPHPGANGTSLKPGLPAALTGVHEEAGPVAAPVTDSSGSQCSSAHLSSDGTQFRCAAALRRLQDSSVRWQQPELAWNEMLAVPESWLLLVCCLVGIGSCLVLLNNARQLSYAVSGSEAATDVLIQLFAIGSCSGRLLAGLIPERLLQTNGTARTGTLMVVALLNAVWTLAASRASLPLLMPIALVAGCSLGSHFSLFPTITSELFGLNNLAVNYSIVQAAPALGTYLLSSRLAGGLYDAAAARQSESEHHHCRGPACFQPTFLILSALSMIYFACALMLFLRTRGLYRALFHHYQRELQEE